MSDFLIQRTITLCLIMTIGLSGCKDDPDVMPPVKTTSSSKTNPTTTNVQVIDGRVQASTNGQVYGPGQSFEATSNSVVSAPFPVAGDVSVVNDTSAAGSTATAPPFVYDTQGVADAAFIETNTLVGTNTAGVLAQTQTAIVPVPIDTVAAIDITACLPLG